MSQYDNLPVEEIIAILNGGKFIPPSIRQKLEARVEKFRDMSLKDNGSYREPPRKPGTDFGGSKELPRKSGTNTGGSEVSRGKKDFGRIKSKTAEPIPKTINFELENNTEFPELNLSENQNIFTNSSAWFKKNTSSISVDNEIVISWKNIMEMLNKFKMHRIYLRFLELSDHDHFLMGCRFADPIKGTEYSKYFECDKILKEEENMIRILKIYHKHNELKKFYDQREILLEKMKSYRNLYYEFLTDHLNGINEVIKKFLPNRIIPQKNLVDTIKRELELLEFDTDNEKVLEIHNNIYENLKMEKFVQYHYLIKLKYVIRTISLQKNSLDVVKKYLNSLNYDGMNDQILEKLKWFYYLGWIEKIIDENLRYTITSEYFKNQINTIKFDDVETEFLLKDQWNNYLDKIDMVINEVLSKKITIEYVNKCLESLNIDTPRKEFNTKLKWFHYVNEIDWTITKLSERNITTELVKKQLEHLDNIFNGILRIMDPHMDYIYDITIKNANTIIPNGIAKTHYVSYDDKFEFKRQDTSFSDEYYKNITVDDIHKFFGERTSFDYDYFIFIETPEKRFGIKYKIDGKLPFEKGKIRISGLPNGVKTVTVPITKTIKSKSLAEIVECDMNIILSETTYQKLDLKTKKLYALQKASDRNYYVYSLLWDFLSATERYELLN